jgi:hypothetical protein
MCRRWRAGDPPMKDAARTAMQRAVVSRTMKTLYALALAAAMAGAIIAAVPSARADDYCNKRCDHAFNYCQYRGGSYDDCMRQLRICRAQC